MDDSTIERPAPTANLGSGVHLPTLQNSMQILELLANEPAGLCIEQIHHKTNICKSIVHRIVRTLVVWDCLVDRGDGTYSTIDVHFPKGKWKEQIRPLEFIFLDGTVSHEPLVSCQRV